MSTLPKPPWGVVRGPGFEGWVIAWVIVIAIVVLGWLT